MAPPAIIPAAVPPPATNAYTENAFPRSRGSVNVTDSSARPAGFRRAANAP